MARKNCYSASKNPDVMYNVGSMNEENEEKERKSILNQLNSKRKEIKFVKGQDVYVYDPDNNIYIKFFYDCIIGHNIYLKRSIPKRSAYYITESFRVIDYEYGLIGLYTEEEYKAEKRRKLLEEIDKWVKL